MFINGDYYIIDKILALSYKPWDFVNKYQIQSKIKGLTSLSIYVGISDYYKCSGFMSFHSGLNKHIYPVSSNISNN